MNTTTNNKPRTFLAENGEKFVLPSDFPDNLERTKIALNWGPLENTARGNFAALVALLVKGWIPTDRAEEVEAGEVDASQVRYEEWESMKDACALEFGMGWWLQLDLDTQEGTTKNSEWEKEKAIVREWKEDKKGFNRVPKNVWNSLLYGAYSSRRAGLPSLVWMQRAKSNGFAVALVGSIAEIAWSCPDSELSLH